VVEDLVSSIWTYLSFFFSGWWWWIPETRSGVFGRMMGDKTQLDLVMSFGRRELSLFVILLNWCFVCFFRDECVLNLWNWWKSFYNWIRIYDNTESLILSPFENLKVELMTKKVKERKWKIQCYFTALSVFNKFD
jgi:hypothetical protein